MQAFAAARIDDLRIGKRDGDGADGCGGLVVEDWVPCSTKIGGAKDAAIDLRHVECVWLAWHTSDSASPPTAMRSNIPPAQCAAKSGSTWSRAAASNAVARSARKGRRREARLRMGASGNRSKDDRGCEFDREWQLSSMAGGAPALQPENLLPVSFRVARWHDKRPEIETPCSYLL